MSMSFSASTHELDAVIQDLKTLKKRADLPEDAQIIISRIANTVTPWQSAAEQATSQREAAAQKLSKFDHIKTDD